MAKNTAAYVWNMGGPGQLRDQIHDIQQSGLTTVILWALHIGRSGSTMYPNMQTGDLIYNDYLTSDGQCPCSEYNGYESISATFTNWQLPLAGGFLWKYDALPTHPNLCSGQNNLGTYVKAINEALEKKTPARSKRGTRRSAKRRSR